MYVAILFRGGISKVFGNYSNPGSIDEDSEFINYKCAYNSFVKHILEPNKEHNIDTFIHTWHPELEEDLINLYQPKKILTEQNDKYFDEIKNKLIYSEVDDKKFGAVSHALSLNKVCEMTKKYSEENNLKYDLILIYRLDLLLVVNLIFNSYNNNIVTCNYMYDRLGDCIGDFHFVMNYQSMLEFGKIYDFLSPKLKPVYHYHFPEYIRFYMGRRLIRDNIVAGFFQETVRKASTLVAHQFVKPEDLLKYGTTYEELLSYKH